METLFRRRVASQPAKHRALEAVGGGCSARVALERRLADLAVYIANTRRHLSPGTAHGCGGGGAFGGSCQRRPGKVKQQQALVRALVREPACVLSGRRWAWRMRAWACCEKHHHHLASAAQRTRPFHRVARCSSASTTAAYARRALPPAPCATLLSSMCVCCRPWPYVSIGACFMPRAWHLGSTWRLVASSSSPKHSAECRRRAAMAPT